MRLGNYGNCIQPLNSSVASHADPHPDSPNPADPESGQTAIPGLLPSIGMGLTGMGLGGNLLGTTYIGSLLAQNPAWAQLSSPAVARALQGPRLGISGIPNLYLGLSPIPTMPQWPSSSVAKALAGLGPSDLHGTKKIDLGQLQHSEAMENARLALEALDKSGFSLGDILGGIADEMVKQKQLSELGGDFWKAGFAIGRIGYVILSPSDEGKGRKLVSIFANLPAALVPLADFVPHGASLKATLLALDEFSGQFEQALAQTNKG